MWPGPTAARSHSCVVPYDSSRHSSAPPVSTCGGEACRWRDRKCVLCSIEPPGLVCTQPARDRTGAQVMPARAYDAELSRRRGSLLGGSFSWSRVKHPPDCTKHPDQPRAPPPEVLCTDKLFPGVPSPPTNCRDLPQAHSPVAPRPELGCVSEVICYKTGRFRADLEAHCDWIYSPPDMAGRDPLRRARGGQFAMPTT